MRALISIIIPVYKVENYLKECIDSVLGQTYENLEIILVDDGSPDSCPKICDDYARLDSRIKVIHKVNGGLSSARNVGLDIFNGDYVQFVDSDDVIDCNMVKNLYETIISTKADICCCKYYKAKTENKNFKSDKYNIEIFNNKEILEDLYCNKLQNVICCNKLFDKKLFQQIRFPLGKICEDIFTTYKIFYKASKIAKISYIGYFYRDTVGSITNVFNVRRLDSLEAYKEALDFFNKKVMWNLCKENAKCAVIAIMRFWYFSNTKDVKKTLQNYFDLFCPIAIKDEKLSLLKIRCLIFKHFKILNSCGLYLSDLFNTLKYKTQTKIMG